jgi:predicted NAD/FAD-dependent oxidoreductase
MAVKVFEKSRGVGGRMATRRVEGLQFDHGTQYFTVRDARFRAFIDDLIDRGVVQRWDARVVILRQGQVEVDEQAKERIVGVPTMNAICRHLAQGANVHKNTRIAAADRRRDGWHLRDDQGRAVGVYDYLLMTAPAPQVAELLPPESCLVPYARSARMIGCWAGMFAFADPLPLDFDGAFVVQSPVNWLARDSSKPQRDARHNTWVVHASSEWSAANLDRDAADVGPQLLTAFFEACGLEARRTLYAAAHRWRFALAAESLAAGAIYDADNRIGAGGDWCQEPRVEGAFLSGWALADKVRAAQQATSSGSDT